MMSTCRRASRDDISGRREAADLESQFGWSDQQERERSKAAYTSSRRIGCTIKSGEYDLMAPAAVGEQMTCERSTP